MRGGSMVRNNILAMCLILLNIVFGFAVLFVLLYLSESVPTEDKSGVFKSLVYCLPYIINFGYVIVSLIVMYLMAGKFMYDFGKISTNLWSTAGILIIMGIEFLFWGGLGAHQMVLMGLILWIAPFEPIIMDICPNIPIQIWALIFFLIEYGVIQLGMRKSSKKRTVVE